MRLKAVTGQVHTANKTKHGILALHRCWCPSEGQVLTRQETEQPYQVSLVRNNFFFLFFLDVAAL